MYIRSVKFKNVFAFGNRETAIDFTDGNKFWQIIGKNGVGKSSFIKILKIGLYQELEGLKLDEIAHQINKQGFIEINVDNNGSNFIIQSFFSPHSIKVFKNGNSEPENWGGKDDTKKRIRTEIATIPYHIFNNTISLAVNDFKSFLNMSPKDSREIRDRIFGFFIFNQMAEDFKAENSEYNKEFSNLNSEISTLNDQLDRNLEIKNQLVEKIKESNLDRIKEYESELNRLDAILNDQLEKLQKSRQTKMLLNSFLEINKNFQLESSISSYETELERWNESLKREKEKTEKEKTEINRLISERNLVFNKQLKAEIEKSKIDLELNKQILFGIKSDYDTMITDIGIIKEKKKEKEKELYYIGFISDTRILESKFNEITQLRNNHELSLTNVENVISKSIDNIKNSELEIAKLVVEKRELHNKLILFESGKCESCGSDLTTHDNQDRKIEIENNIVEIESKISKITDIKFIEKNNLDKNIIFKEEICATIAINDKNKSEIINKLTILWEDGRTKIADLLPELPNLGSTESISIVFSDIDTITENIEDISENLINKEKVALDIKETGTKLKNEILSIQSSIQTNEKNVKPTSSTDESLLYSSENEYDLEISRKNEILEKLQKIVSDTTINTDTMITKIRQLKSEMNNGIPEKIIEKYNSTESLVNLSLEDRESEITNKLVNINNDLENINDLISKTKTDIADINIKKISLENEKNFENQLDSINAILESTKLSIDIKNKEIRKITDKLMNNDFVLYTLGDEGLKSYILKSIIPSINYEISQYLTALSIPLEVSFNDTFEVSVKRFGMEANLKSISLGQTKMIDCCILLAITKIIKMKYTDINLVFYDEVFSSLDSDNRPIIIEMFYKICCEMLKMNVFMVGHFYIPIQHDSKILEIKSDGRFSEMNIYEADEYTKLSA